MISFVKRQVFNVFKKEQVTKHELNYLFWECTTRCNLNCLHCGSDCSKNASYKDMPMADFLSALDTIKEVPENFIVAISGGEPLLRSDIEQCGREIRKRGMRWGMVTNGYAYTPERHVSLLNSGMGSLTISLDGLKDTHNWLRNSKKSFEKTDRAISLAASATRLNFDVVTCVNKRNIHELPQIYNYLIEKGVTAWRLFTIIPIGRAKNDVDLLLSDHEFRQLMDFISRQRKLKKIDIKFSCEGYVGKYELKVRDSYFFCRAGINIGSILIDGSISACPNIDRKFVQGNIYSDNFYSVWQQKFQLFRDRTWTKTGICSTCSEFKNCEGNGLHNWHNNSGNVLVCHHKKILNSTLISQD